MHFFYTLAQVGDGDQAWIRTFVLAATLLLGGGGIVGVIVKSVIRWLEEDRKKQHDELDQSRRDEKEAQDLVLKAHTAIMMTEKAYHDEIISQEKRNHEFVVAQLNQQLERNEKREEERTAIMKDTAEQLKTVAISSQATVSALNGHIKNFNEYRDAGVKAMESIKDIASVLPIATKPKRIRKRTS